MKVTCGGEVPYTGTTIAELIEVLSSFPSDAEIKNVGFDRDIIRVWWEEER